MNKNEIFGMMVIFGLLIFAPSLLILFFIGLFILWVVCKIVGVDLFKKLKGDDSV